MTGPHTQLTHHYIVLQYDQKYEHDSPYNHKYEHHNYEHEL